jgi:hypothetical protein
MRIAREAWLIRMRVTLLVVKRLDAAKPNFGEKVIGI